MSYLHPKSDSRCVSQTDAPQASRPMQEKAEYKDGPEKMPAVEVAVTRLSSLLASLNGATTNLADKLSPVLQPLPPLLNKGEEMKSAGCPLADDLMSLGDRAEAVLHRLQNIHDNLEV